MSLYGPRLRLPKIDIPNPASPSWNLDKEKKWIFAGIIVIIVIALIVLIGPVIVNKTGELLGNSFNPAIQITWKNNPLDLKANPIEPAELTISFTNTTKQEQNITFSLSYPNKELLEYCPEYTLLNVAEGDKRTVTCFIRRNGEIFTGTYSIDIISNLGNSKTKLEVIGK